MARTGVEDSGEGSRKWEAEFLLGQGFGPLLRGLRRVRRGWASPPPAGVCVSPASKTGVDTRRGFAQIGTHPPTWDFIIPNWFPLRFVARPAGPKGVREH